MQERGECRFFIFLCMEISIAWIIVLILLWYYRMLHENWDPFYRAAWCTGNWYMFRMNFFGQSRDVMAWSMTIILGPHILLQLTYLTDWGENFYFCLKQVNCMNFVISYRVMTVCTANVWFMISTAFIRVLSISCTPVVILTSNVCYYK